MCLYLDKLDFRMVYSLTIFLLRHSVKFTASSQIHTINMYSHTCILSLTQLCNFKCGIQKFKYWLLRQKMISSSIKRGSATTTLNAELQRQKLSLGCIHVKHALWTPVYCISCSTFGVVWIWTLWCVYPSTVPMNVAPQLSFYMLFKNQLDLFEKYLVNEWFCFKNYFWSDLCSFFSL